MSDEMDDVEWLREWCGSALNKCADEIERLREEVERLKSEESCNDVLLEYAQAENERLREENARLREALRPFANDADYEYATYSGAYLRAAAAAIRNGDVKGE